MKALLLAAALAAPSSAGDLPSAPVWLPDEGFTAWAAVEPAVRAHGGGLKLTIGVTPAMATAAARDALAGLLAEGRVELAARLPGDPVLAWTAAHPLAPRPEDVLERLVEAREALKGSLGAAPAGFVPGAGSLHPSFLSGLRASGAEWVLTGPYAGEDWAADGKVSFVPARAATGPVLAELSAPGAAVYADSGPASAFLEALGSGKAEPDEGFALVRDLLAIKPPLASAAETAWRPWDPRAEGAPPEPDARASWEAYGEAARALQTYQNSGTADLPTLEAATAALRQAQAARYFRPRGPETLGGPAAAVPDPALRSKLVAVYKRLRVPAPESLFAAAGGPADPAADRPTGVRAARGASWVSFESPAGSEARAPAVSTAAAGAAAPADAEPWRLKGLRVEWTDAAVSLTLAVGRAAAKPAAPRPVYELYADVNGVVGAGSLRPLEPRGIALPARDAWEYAVSIAGEEAALYRPSPRGAPERLGAYPASVDEAKGSISVSIPRSALRGSPARWGWLALSYAEDPARPGRTPPAPLAGPDGGIVLGVLAPLEAQKAALGRRFGARLPAARAAD